MKFGRKCVTKRLILNDYLKPAFAGFYCLEESKMAQESRLVIVIDAKMQSVMRGI